MFNSSLREEQKNISDRIGKLNHSIEVTIRRKKNCEFLHFFRQVCLYQQKERDSHTNLNRDLVLLVILVVMIQVIHNCV